MDGVNVSHDLDFAENRSTYEEPQRLLDDFYSAVFPRSPIPPVPPLYWTGCPPDTELSDGLDMTTMGDESTDMSDAFESTTHTKYSKEKNDPDSRSSAESTNTSKDESSPVPLSIVVAVGCALIFLNLLICAGMYYHRRRLRKLRERPPTGNGNDVSDNRNNDRSLNRDTTPPGATNLVHSSDASLPKVANMNHKPAADTAPAYSTLPKSGANPQGPGGYTYSALSQRSSSPMHTHNHIHFADPVSQQGPPSEDGSQSSSSKGQGSISERPASGANQVPKLDTRVKHIPRGTQQVSSNNAITIV